MAKEFIEIYFPFESFADPEAAQNNGGVENARKVPFDGRGHSHGSSNWVDRVRRAVQRFVEKHNAEAGVLDDRCVMVRHTGGEWEKWEVECLVVATYHAKRAAKRPRKTK